MELTGSQGVPDLASVHRVVWKETLLPERTTTAMGQLLKVPGSAVALRVGPDAMNRAQGGELDALWFECIGSGPDKDAPPTQWRVWAVMTGQPVMPGSVFLGAVVHDGWVVVNYYGAIVHEAEGALQP